LRIGGDLEVRTMPKIWWRESKKAYYLQIDRNTQKRLGKTLTEAEMAYREWILDHGESLPRREQKKLTVAELAQVFLDRVKAKKKPKTYDSYCYFICPFVERFGAAPASTFPLLTFEKWLDEHRGWKGCRRNAIVSVLVLFNWGIKKRLLWENPLRGVEIPPKKRRNRILTPDEREYLLKAIRDEQFREFVFAMLETGCRPPEVINVTANHVSCDGTTWILDDHKTEAKTGEARVIYLGPAMQELTRKLVGLYPEGPLFRSTRRLGGVRRPWTLNGNRCRFKRLREKVAKLRANEKDPEKRKKIADLSGITAYACRHSFATHALTNGLPIPVVSALLGHRSTRMVDETYNHSNQACDVLRVAVKKAGHRPNGASG
jgi:integrase